MNIDDALIEDKDKEKEIANSYEIIDEEVSQIEKLN